MEYNRCVKLRKLSGPMICARNKDWQNARLRKLVYAWPQEKPEKSNPETRAHFPAQFDSAFREWHSAKSGIIPNSHGEV